MLSVIILSSFDPGLNRIQFVQRLSILNGIRIILWTYLKRHDGRTRTKRCRRRWLYWAVYIRVYMWKVSDFAISVDWSCGLDGLLRTSALTACKDWLEPVSVHIPDALVLAPLMVGSLRFLPLLVFDRLDTIIHILCIRLVLKYWLLNSIPLLILQNLPSFIKILIKFLQLLMLIFHDLTPGSFRCFELLLLFQSFCIELIRLSLS